VGLANTFSLLMGLTVTVSGVALLSDRTPLSIGEVLPMVCA
jgi:hypothetical protein